MGQFNRTAQQAMLKMKNFGFVFVFLAVGLKLAESKPSEDRAPSELINCGCQCSNLIYSDGDGKVQGNCRSADSSGSLWCFAVAGSTCQDIQTTAKGPYGKDWSYEACATPTCPPTANPPTTIKPTKITPWIQYGSKLMMIVAVGPFGVWGVSSDNKIWEKTSSSWKQIGGGLADISVGKSSVWGVNQGQQTWMREGNGGWEHIKNPGKFNQISVSGSDNGNVWATDTDKKIHRWTGSGWESIAGELTVVSCGEPGVWGVNHEDEVYYRTGTYGGGPSEGTGWEKLDGLLTWISSGAAGEVWGTNKEGEVWRREGISTSKPTGTAWKKVSSGSMKKVSIWGGQAWAVNNKDQIFYANKK